MLNVYYFICTQWRTHFDLQLIAFSQVSSCVFEGNLPREESVADL